MEKCRPNGDDEYEPLDDPSLTRRQLSNLMNKKALSWRGRGTLKIKGQPTSQRQQGERRSKNVHDDMEERISRVAQAIRDKARTSDEAQAMDEPLGPFKMTPPIHQLDVFRRPIMYFKIV